MAGTLDLERLADTWEPQMKAAFLSAIKDKIKRIDINALVRLLENGDVPGALRLVGLEPANFSALALVHQQIFNTGGLAVAAAAPAIDQAAGYALHVLFDVRNPRAEQIIRDLSGNLITEIVDDQRVAIRGALEQGLVAGSNPRTTALDLIGRIDPVTRQRIGGIIGLHSNQIQWLENYKAKLASTDPADLRAALDYGLRDKRFDRVVLKAIEDGTAVPADMQVKAGVSFANRALKWRGDNIARTETMQALGAAQTEAYQQAIDDGKVDVELITRFPVTAGDDRVRPTHRAVPGMNPDGRKWNEPFATPFGPQMHAPYPSEINCRCYERVKIDFIGKAVNQFKAEAVDGGGQ